jgi:hypothetical protein
MKVRGFSGGDVTTGGTLTLPSPLQRERRATRKIDMLRVQRGIDKFENNGLLAQLSNDTGTVRIMTSWAT